MMKRVKYFGLKETVWEMCSWNGEGIKNLWQKILHMLDYYLHTEIDMNKIGCTEKIRKGAKKLENLLQ